MSRFSSILLLIVVLLFGAGLKQLFDLRFQSGDMYPKYSSLRADPLGTKALYESYERLVPASRNYRPLHRLTHGQGTALFLLGLKTSDLLTSSEEATQLETFVKSGGRLVLGLAATESEGTQVAPRARGTKGQQTTPGPNPEPELESGRVLISDRWGFELEFPKKETSRSASLVKEMRLPEEIPFRSPVVFKNLGPEWQPIYQRGTNGSVLIERPMGLGSIVMAAESYLFSNEAMLKERQASLLAWLTRDRDRIIFDETHLGVHENTGVASLARKYRLHGVGLGVLLLAALYLWKNAVPFLPPHPNEIQSGTVLLGKDSAAGFINLLRRNVSTMDLLPTCIQEWQKSCGNQTARSKLLQVQRIIDAENAKEPRQRNPVLIYEEIRRVLAKPNRSASTASQPQTGGEILKS